MERNREVMKMVVEIMVEKAEELNAIISLSTIISIVAIIISLLAVMNLEN